jgi:phosphoribosyl-dephospho-CoA transferase
MPGAPIRRHDWVYLRAGCEPRLAAGDARLQSAVQRWIADDRPLVATRRVNEAQVSLGLALHEGGRIARIGCAVAPHDVLRHRNPLTVEEALQVLGDVDGAALRRFADAIAGHALQVGVYGSTAWQYFGGRSYRHAASDVDVVCDVASVAGIDACLAAFRDGTRRVRSPLDGEVRVPGGRAIAWRELDAACAGGAQVVLAKDERGVALVALHRLLASLR